MVLFSRFVGDTAKVRGAHNRGQGQEIIYVPSPEGVIDDGQGSRFAYQAAQDGGPDDAAGHKSCQDLDGLGAVKRLLAGRRSNGGSTRNSASLLRPFPQVSRNQDIHHRISAFPSMLVPLEGFALGFEAEMHQQFREVVKHRWECPDVECHVRVLSSPHGRSTSLDSVQENGLAAYQNPSLGHRAMYFKDRLPSFLLFAGHCRKFNGHGLS